MKNDKENINKCKEKTKLDNQIDEFLTYVSVDKRLSDATRKSYKWELDDYKRFLAKKEKFNKVSSSLFRDTCLLVLCLWLIHFLYYLG